jgi:hypothetical protein
LTHAQTTDDYDVYYEEEAYYYNSTATAADEIEDIMFEDDDLSARTKMEIALEKTANQLGNDLHKAVF